MMSRGRLGVGADADTTIEAPGNGLETTLAVLRYASKGGVRLVEEGRIRRDLHGLTLKEQRGRDTARQGPLQDLVEEEGSLFLNDEGIAAGELRRSETVAGA